MGIPFKDTSSGWLALELGVATQLDIPAAERVNFNEVNAIVFTIIYAAL